MFGPAFFPFQELYYGEAEAVVAVCKCRGAPRDGAPAPLIALGKSVVLSHPLAAPED